MLSQTSSILISTVSGRVAYDLANDDENANHQRCRHSLSYKWLLGNQVVVFFVSLVFSLLNAFVVIAAKTTTAAGTTTTLTPTNDNGTPTATATANDNTTTASSTKIATIVGLFCSSVLLGWVLFGVVIMCKRREGDEDDDCDDLHRWMYVVILIVLFHLITQFAVMLFIY